MYLMYVDESGDTGVTGSNTDFFILSGVVVHELDFAVAYNDFHDFRKKINASYGFHVRKEFHAVTMVNGNMTENDNIQKNERFVILRDTIKWMASRKELSLITVVAKKHGFEQKEEIFRRSWTALIQRFENTLKAKNFNGSKNNVDKGIIIADNTDAGAVRKIQRKMHVINYIPSLYGEPRNIPIVNVIEDPMFKDSRLSSFVQLADIAAYFSMQYLSPNKFVKRQGVKRYFELLEPIMMKCVYPKDKFGRVWIEKQKGAK